uniref:Secreted protein n=1 Tax=Anopheles minimus TaxID=112268 RepID=A0A182WQ68_9DIPT
MFDRKFVVVVAVLSALISFIVAAPQDGEETIRFGDPGSNNAAETIDPTRDGADVIQEQIPDDQELPADIHL